LCRSCKQGQSSPIFSSNCTTRSGPCKAMGRWWHWVSGCVHQATKG
jgi:hypothetical protein